MFSITTQLLPGLLVDSVDFHPSKELFPEGNAKEIIHLRGDKLHYPPTSQAIIVYYSMFAGCNLSIRPGDMWWAAWRLTITKTEITMIFACQNIYQVDKRVPKRIW